MPVPKPSPNTLPTMPLAGGRSFDDFGDKLILHSSIKKE